MSNTLSTYALRHKYFQTNLQLALQNALVAEKICKVDRSELKTIENPYITAFTPTIQTVTGTYQVSAMTVTDDALSVNDEVISPTHVFDFESKTANFNLISDFLDELMYSVSWKIDQFVLNTLANTATGTYSTPAGGFGTASNIAIICSNLLSKVDGYRSGVASSPFLVVENTDTVGLRQAAVASGTTYADAALNNSMVMDYMGIKIYVVRTATFVTATLGNLSATNDGKRLFGLSNLAVYASPRGMNYVEKDVTLKLGKEVVAYGYIGAKIWVPHRSLFVLITLV